MNRSKKSDIVSQIKDMQWNIEPISPSPQGPIFQEVLNTLDQLIALSFCVPNAEAIMVEEASQRLEILEKYPEAQINDEGQIALRCIREGQFLITGCPSGKEYIAVTEANICLVWVEPEDVSFIMTTKKLGCCGKKKLAYYLADEAHVRRWTNRGGR